MSQLTINKLSMRYWLPFGSLGLNRRAVEKNLKGVNILDLSGCVIVLY